MSIITLTTDFGLKDGNVATMKGVIWCIAPTAQITDISHLVQPQNILEASAILSISAPFFPPDTVHVVVIDPGVGTARRPIAAKVGSQYYVCPDNGVLTFIINEALSKKIPIESILLDNRKFWLPAVSDVFHGRDIFAPIAAHIANGIKMHVLGSSISDLTIQQIPTPVSTEDGYSGEIIYIDNFGNIVTNISKQLLNQSTDVIIKLCSIELKGMVKTFGDRPPGEIIALYGGSETLIVSVVNGNAAKKLNAKIGEKVQVLSL